MTDLAWAALKIMGSFGEVLGGANLLAASYGVLGWTMLIHGTINLSLGVADFISISLKQKAVSAQLLPKQAQLLNNAIGAFTGLKDKLKFLTTSLKKGAKWIDIYDATISVIGAGKDAWDSWTLLEASN